MSVILVTGAATGIGNLTARALAADRHIVYASMRDPGGRNAAVPVSLRGAQGGLRRACPGFGQPLALQP